jgi:hypothetical protein
MRFRVDGSKALFADVCVALRGGHVAMAQQILYHAEVRPTIQQVRCEAVPQRVGMRWTEAATVDDAPNVARRQPHSSFVAEQCGARIRCQHVPAKGQLRDQRLDGRRTERHTAFLAALPPHADRCSRQIQRVDVE